MEISRNAQAILLLTAPLIVGRNRSSVTPLTPAEYRRLARWLRERKRQPANLLESGADALMRECSLVSDSGRLKRLLDRGFLLSQAVEQWRARAIWIISRADAGYPRRLKKRLGEDAPPIVYGGGDPTVLDTGGLAVVGSRDVDDALIEYTEEVGRLAASARRTLVSGGARGIDQAAMRGALRAGGHVAGILSDSLERAVMRREHREALMDGRLAVVSPYDPAARFHIGHAMQRNKLIYALSDAALVVNSDYRKGGTWSGATEQLEKLHFVPVFVRSHGGMGKGLEELQRRGALAWPHPETPEALEDILDTLSIMGNAVPHQRMLSVETRDGGTQGGSAQETETASTTVEQPPATSGSSLAADLFAKVRDLFERMDVCRAESEVADELQISKRQVEVWLNRFAEEKATELFERERATLTEAEVAETLRIPKRLARRCLKRLVEKGAIEKLSRPIGYRYIGSVGPLFDRGG